MRDETEWKDLNFLMPPKSGRKSKGDSSEYIRISNKGHFYFSKMFCEKIKDTIDMCDRVSLYFSKSKNAIVFYFVDSEGDLIEDGLLFLQKNKAASWKLNKTKGGWIHFTSRSFLHLFSNFKGEYQPVLEEVTGFKNKKWVIYLNN